jgi:hypothetical protein
MGVVSTIFVGLRNFLANAGVEYMVSAGSNPVLPAGENLDLSLTLSPFEFGVNAERTTSRNLNRTLVPQDEPSWSNDSSSGVNTVLTVFSILSPRFNISAS